MLKNSKGIYSTTRIGIIIIFILLFVFVITSCKDQTHEEDAKYEEVMKDTINHAYTYQIQILALENEKNIDEIKKKFNLYKYELQLLYKDDLTKYIIGDVFNNYKDATKFKNELGIEDAFLICYDENFNEIKITNEIIK